MNPAPRERNVPLLILSGLAIAVVFVAVVTVVVAS